MMPLILENFHLRLTVDPAAGGKITGLQDLHTGRQWLWTNPYIPQEIQPYGASYIGSLDTGGWDEIFPSVLPCQVGPRMIPDHGDLVSLPWEVLEASSQHLEMEVITRFARCRLRRTLTLEGRRLQIGYRLENLEGESIPYLWCAHPLIAIQPGMKILLPEGTPMTNGDADFAWPHSPGLPPLDKIPDPHSEGFQPFAAKVFSAPGSVGELTLATADDKEALRLEWDTQEVPYLGLWLNCAAWSGCGSPSYFNLGIEPATAPFDSLEEAILHHRQQWIGPGESRCWSLGLSVFPPAGNSHPV